LSVWSLGYYLEGLESSQMDHLACSALIMKDTYKNNNQTTDQV